MDVMNLVARLSLDNSEYESGLVKAGKSVMKWGSMAVAAATAATTAFATSAIKVGMDFDKSMSQVYATMGDKAEAVITQGEYAGQKSSEALRDFAQEMGRTTAFTATQSAEALNYMALAGYNATESMDMLPNVMNLAAAGSFELGRASDMLTDTQTALGLSFARTNQMVDEWAKAASTGNTSVEQLGDAFLVVGGLAQELNGGMVALADGTTAPVDGVQELEIALTAMANAGIKGSEAGTHMRNMLLKLSSPTSDGAEQLEALGVSVFDTEGKMRSLNDIFGDLDGALGDLTQEQKIQAISDLFNARDIASAEALLNAIGEDWDAIGSEILDADGAAQEMAETQLDNLAGDVTLFKSALEGAQIALSDGVSPALRKFVQAGTEGVSEFTEKIKEGDYNGAAQSIGTTLGEGIIMGLSKLPSLASAGFSLLEGLGQGISSALPSFSGEFGSIATASFIGGISLKGDSLIATGFEIIQSLMDGISNASLTLLPAAGAIAGNLLTSLGEQAPALIGKGVEMVGNLVVGLIAAAPSIIAGGIKLVAGLIKGLGSGLKALPKVMINAGKLAIAGFKNINWKNVGYIAVKLLLSGLKRAADIASALKNLAKRGINAFKGSNWKETGRNIITGLINGIKAGARAVANALKEIAKGALKAAKEALGINSPSRVFRDEVGLGISEGIAKGIDEGDGLITKSLSKLSKHSAEIDIPIRTSTNADEIMSQMAIDESLSIQSNMAEMQSEFAEMRKDLVDLGKQITYGMAEAVEGLTITLDKRVFGKATRKAVGAV